MKTFRGNPLLKFWPHITACSGILKWKIQSDGQNIQAKAKHTAGSCFAVSYCHTILPIHFSHDTCPTYNTVVLVLQYNLPMSIPQSLYCLSIALVRMQPTWTEGILLSMQNTISLNTISCIDQSTPLPTYLRLHSWFCWHSYTNQGYGLFAPLTDVAMSR